MQSYRLLSRRSFLLIAEGEDRDSFVLLSVRWGFREIFEYGHLKNLVIDSISSWDVFVYESGNKLALFLRCAFLQ